MKLDIYQVDAFADRIFDGNPAAVIPLKEWLSQAQMQSIAQENNLSETAFFCKSDDHYHIKWFTPNSEVKLCGHATLATAFVIFNIMDYKLETILFNSLSGELSVERNGDLFKMDFPSQNPIKCDIPEALELGLGARPKACYFNEDYLAVFESEKNIINIEPDYQKLIMLKSRGVIVTAPGSQYDFVSRAFFPKYGVPEDPVTGSAHTKLVPYWFNRTGKTKFEAKQISKRSGDLFCEYKRDRVLISGSARLYMKGEILIS